MKSMRIAWIILITSLFTARLCTAAAMQGPDLQIALTGQSHPSGLYHVGDQTTLKIRIRNPGASAQMLSGNLRWMIKRGHGKVPTLLATTPIRPTMLTSGQIVRIALPETFSAVGRYELLYHKTIIQMRQAFQSPRCIYAPSSTLTGKSVPWIASMPQPFISAHPAGFIGSFISETGIRQYLFNINLSTHHRTGFETRESRMALRLKRSGARLIPVLTISAADTRQSPLISSNALIQQLKTVIGICPAIVVRFSSAPTPAMAGVADALIPRLHDALQALNSSVPIFATPDVIGAGKGNMALTSLIGGVALSDTYQSMRLCHHLEQSNAALPVMILPRSYSLPNGISNHAAPNPALFLAAAATYVPVPAHANNFELHVLGTGQLFSIVHPHLAFLAAVFKQPYGSCAIVSGPGSGEVADHQWIAWRNNPPGMIKDDIWRTAIADGHLGWKRLLALIPPAGKFPRGKLIVVDAEGLMATRNTRGRSVPAPYPGWQEIPLNRHVYFLTYPGTPSDLAAALRTASIKGLPAADVTIASNVSTKDIHTLTLSIRNARLGRLLGNISVWELAKLPTGNRVLQISSAVRFGPIHSGNTALVTLHIHPTAGMPETKKLMAVLTWRHWVELTALVIRPTRAEGILRHVVPNSTAPHEPQTNATAAGVPVLSGIPANTDKTLPSRTQSVQNVELPYMPPTKTR